MNKLHLPKIEALPGTLVTPERFLKPELLGWGGEAVLAQVIPLPETARIFSPDAA